LSEDSEPVLRLAVHRLKRAEYSVRDCKYTEERRSSRRLITSSTDYTFVEDPVSQERISDNPSDGRRI